MFSRARIGWFSAYLVVVVAAWAGLHVYRPVRVAGGSMKPALHPGDLVLVATGRSGLVGDIVLLESPGKGPVLHRVVASEAGGAVRTQGDANETADPSLTDAKHVRGPVIGVVPVGKLLSRWRGD